MKNRLLIAVILSALTAAFAISVFAAEETTHNQTITLSRELTWEIIDS